jgi:hypothetical protein
LPNLLENDFWWGDDARGACRDCTVLHVFVRILDVFSRFVSYFRGGAFYAYIMETIDKTGFLGLPGRNAIQT